MLRNSRVGWLQVFGVAIVASALALLTFAHTTSMPIIKDAAQNTRAAYYLVHAGVISTDNSESKDPKPQMRREPLPIVVMAAFLLLHPAFDEPYTIPDLTQGRLTETVKGVNAFWRFLAAIFAFLLCFELFSARRVAFAAAVICIAASELFFFSKPGVVDRLYTELPEVALMLLASWSAVRFVRVKSWPRALWLGISLGLLALCKCSFLYIGLGFILLLLVTDRAEAYRTDAGKPAWRHLFLTYALITLAMFATVAPWIARNALLFGNPQIASGTDVSVLGTRLLLMQEPLLGQVYLYSPPTIRKVIGPVTGYSAADLKPGGRLDVVRQVKENRTQLIEQLLERQGYQGDHSKWIRQQIVHYVAANPIRYVASIPVFAYKGMWFMTSIGWPFNFAAILCFLAVFCAALVTRDQLLLAAFGLPAGLFLFLSIFTHALTRYTSPMTPFVVLSMLWVASALARRAYHLPRVRAFADRWRPKLGSRRARIVSMSTAETA